MSEWICIPSTMRIQDGLNIFNNPYDYYDNKKKIGTCIIVESDKIVYIDTEDLQKSLYESFNEIGWENGKTFNVSKDDIFSIKEYKKYFEIFINDKFVATFCKKQDISNFDFEGE